jgi:hypothetical protein
VTKHPGFTCCACEDHIDLDQAHWFALGPMAGHYCIGCEPGGHQLKMVNKENYEPAEHGDAWSGGFADNH